MKKLIFCFLFLPNVLIAQKLEKYCEIMAVQKMFSSKVAVTVNFGDQTNKALRDSSGTIINFNSVIDALNFMGKNNWKLVNAFPISEPNAGQILHFYFKKEYDASEISK